MAGVIAQSTATQLRAAVDDILGGHRDVPAAAAAAFRRLVDVLEASPDAVIFASEQTISTQQAAALLGVSRMTVVRLIDRGELAADTAAVHRHISVSELARYQRENKARRSVALDELAGDISETTPPDEVISTW
jgi:excisionase family DNA binding protein